MPRPHQQTPYRERAAEHEPEPTRTVSDGEAFRVGFKKLMRRWSRVATIALFSPQISIVCMLLDSVRYVRIKSIELGHKEAGIESERVFEPSIRPFLKAFNEGIEKTPTSYSDMAFPFLIFMLAGGLLQGGFSGVALGEAELGFGGLGTLIGALVHIPLLGYIITTHPPVRIES